MGVRQRAEFSHMHIYIQGFLPPPLPSYFGGRKIVGCMFLSFWRGTTLLKRAEQRLRAEGAYGPAFEQKRQVKFRMAQDLLVLLQWHDSEQMQLCICDPGLVPPFQLAVWGGRKGLPSLHTGLSVGGHLAKPQCPFLPLNEGKMRTNKFLESLL